jgi:Domain of unknown function (DUF4905)
MIKKLYSFSNSREIWRLISAGEDKLLIEERNKKTKEVYFNCIQLKTGKKLLKSYQLKDKFWIGVEAVHNNIIFFHRYIKPDLPTHKDIIAFDLTKEEILWENNDLVFLTISDGNLYGYKALFEGREFYKLNIHTGNVIKKFEESPDENSIEQFQNSAIKDFCFSTIYSNDLDLDGKIRDIIRITKEENVITGRIEFLVYKNVLSLSFHTPGKNGKLNKLLNVVDIVTGKIILKKIINSNIKVFIPDSFFLIKNYLFVLIETKKLFCYILK